MTDQPILESAVPAAEPSEPTAAVENVFVSLAEELAQAHRVSFETPVHRLPIFENASNFEELLQQAYQHFSQVAEGELIASYAGEWLLDNYYIVQQSLRQVHADMPRSYYAELPRLTTTELQGYPRIYSLAQAFTEVADRQFNLEQVEAFTAAYQDRAALTMGELWAWPIMLRVTMLEDLVLALNDLLPLGVAPGEIAPPTAAFGQTADSSAETIVAHCITSLRQLGTQDWATFFEDTSRVETILRRDPSATYAQMDFDTRNRYRLAIETLAKHVRVSEEQVAQAVLTLAQEAAERNGHISRVPDAQFLEDPTAHVGFYLVDTGRRQLEAALHYQINWPRRLRQWMSDRPLLFYLGTVLLLTLVVCLLAVRYAVSSGGSLIQVIATGLLVLLPASAIAVNLVNWMASRLVAPHVLPKMDFSEGIPSAYRTMVIIPCLLTDEAEVDSLAGQLELHYLRNSDPHLSFAILADYTDAPEQHMPDDVVLLERARQAVEALNERHGANRRRPFYVFLRERRWNPAENVWMGYERKRGKLMEFNRLILDPAADTSYTVKVGELSVLPQTRYVITLDADTVLPRDSAHRLVGTLAHPLNQARFADNGERVIRGYTVLQPRVEIIPSAASRTRFSRIFAGDTGLDLYTLAVSDTYQDLFKEGIYVGKGIYDVAAFERSLTGRTPENALLSHDLFEGLHGRVALVTDIVLLEDYPAHYLPYTRRNHRWIRGDWQLLPWLQPRVPTEAGPAANRFSALDIWKIIDNLRRSLLQPSAMLLLLLGWLWLPGSLYVWSVLSLIALSVPFVISLINQLADISPDNQWNIARQRGLIRDMLRWGYSIIFLPYEAFLGVEAIGTTLIRLIRRQHLLQWTTAATAMRMFGERQTGVVWQQIVVALVFTVTLGGAVALIRPEALLLALPLLVLWLYSPYAVVILSQPVTQRIEPLSPANLSELRILARRTWLYFEEFIRPESSWLPPDHYQRTPRTIVAWQTSPTNIGLTLLSTLAAYDLGYIGLLELNVRLRFAFDAMDQLEKYRGHLLNWYDTRTLKPLLPRYVSTVDSGNLAGSLVALQYGLQDLQDTSILNQERWDGVSDTIAVLGEILDEIEARHPQVQAGGIRAVLAQMQQRIEAARSQPETWMGLLARLTGPGWSDLNQFQLSFVQAEGERLDPAPLAELRIYLERLRHYLFSMQRDIELLLPWLILLDQAPNFRTPEIDPAIGEAWQALAEALPLFPSFGDVREVYRQARARLGDLTSLLSAGAQNNEKLQPALDWCRQLTEALSAAETAATDLFADFEALQRRAAEQVDVMDFGFLYDTSRHLFHIGYNVASEQLDNSYYDLLASEARLASLIAIAKGDVPQKHWLHMARPVTRIGDRQALLSWSGTMFEYLMPRLLMHTYDGTLLDESAHAIVEHQMAYGKQLGLPWGISESGYYAFDSNLNFQYRAFGVPGLAFKRGQGDDLVVAPYASLLALPIRPQAVLENLEHFKSIGAHDAYGLVEAIDYTPRHLPLGQEFAIVREYMAHHQAMIFLTLDNYLHDNVMVRRFHRDPHVQSVELLLQEQLAQAGFTDLPAQEDQQPERDEAPPLVTAPWKPDIKAPLPEVHYLSNGRYSVMLTAAGSGYSEWEGAALTRWRADTTLDDWGTWIYICDQDNETFWSVGYQPVGIQADSQDVLFFGHKAEIQRRDGDISARMELVVPPDDDLEIRRVTLTNHSEDARHLTLVSYGEVVLALQAGDQRHQAFNKLFIESEFIPEHRALLFRRRLRSSHETPLYALHMLVASEGTRGGVLYETDRARFLGRNRTPRNPAALAGGDVALGGTVGATLDPIMALGQAVELPPHSTIELTFITAAANTRATVLELAERYQRASRIDQAFDQARYRSEREMRQLGLDTDTLAPIQRLLAALLYPHPVLRDDPVVLAANTRAQPGLWAFGISGDYPIVLVEINDETQLDLVHDLIQTHTYWRNRGIRVTLVILNRHDTSYFQRLDQQIHRLIIHAANEMQINRHSGIFILRADQMSQVDLTLLQTAARVILKGADGSLKDQLAQRQWQAVSLPAFVPMSGGESVTGGEPPVARPDNLRFDNGLGGFSADGREYVIYLTPGQHTPAPWINVVANDKAGFIISETGGGFSWVENSGENRLTVWRNDPVSDLPGETLYLRDEETAAVWSPTPQPAPDDAPYLVRHGAGYSAFEHHSQGLEQRLTVFCPPDDPVKIVRLHLKNIRSYTRRITATYYAEWVLGPTRDMTQQYLVPDYEADDHTLLFHNPYSIEFGEYHAFITASQPFHGLTTSRTEFLGRMGSLSQPAALSLIGLSGLIRPGLDPCAAIQLHIDLPPGEEAEIFFVIGQAPDRQQALQLSRRYRDPAAVADAWTGAVGLWRGILDSIKVETPDDALNLLLPWLLYQALACRIWGRSALYQSSGAYGFRDQLQDVLALVHTRPDLTREHILRAARHQFEAGDVLHWWHPPSGRGVRTRFADDLIWLPFAVAHYVATTGDQSILHEEVPFLRGELLRPEEEERYGFYETTPERYTIYEHCRRALEKGTTAGRHGLPLMRAGDWNDGMNRVGIEGRGESVWLAWFLLLTMERFRPLCELMDDKAQADIYQNRIDQLKAAVEQHTWDGEWYLRAFYDDGTPLGSRQNQECQIDSLGQSWGILSGAAPPERAQQAMASVEQHLVRLEEQLVLLFTPPFDKTPRDPGYIKGYPPGIRENGGQYTHAALWVIWAFAEMGRGDLAGTLFGLLNPIHHSDTPDKAAHYRVEPYVIAADVYSIAPHTGRGGWTWYTGSSGWMYRLGVEAILGLRREGAVLRIDPRIPSTWAQFQVHYRYGQSEYHIRVENPDGVQSGVKSILLDGRAQPSNTIPLHDDGSSHEALVTMGL